MEDSREHLFSWDKIPGDDEGRLIEFLKQNFHIDWGKTAKIEKTLDGNAIRVFTKNNSLSLRLNNEKTKTVLTVDDGRIDELVVETENGKLNIYPKEKKNDGPGEEPVGRTSIVLFAGYIIILSFLLLYYLMQLWPTSGSDIKSVLLLVALAGALGGQMHALRSFYWYVGQRKLVWSWLLMYLFLPFVGAILGIIFYIAILGGLLSLQVKPEGTNPIGFAAIATLVGLFSEQAARKLRLVAGTVLTEAQKGKNHHVEPKGINHEEPR